MAEVNGQIGWFRVSVAGSRPTSWHFSHGEVRALDVSTLPSRRTAASTPLAVCGYAAPSAQALVTWREVGRDSSKPICGRCLKAR